MLSSKFIKKLIEKKNSEFCECAVPIDIFGKKNIAFEYNIEFEIKKKSVLHKYLFQVWQNNDFLKRNKYYGTTPFSLMHSKIPNQNSNRVYFDFVFFLLLICSLTIYKNCYAGTSESLFLCFNFLFHSFTLNKCNSNHLSLIPKLNKLLISYCNFSITFYTSIRLPIYVACN